MAAETTYGLGIYASHEPSDPTAEPVATMNSQITIDEAEADRYRSALSAVARLSSTPFGMKLVERNYAELLARLKFARITLGLQLRRDRSDDVHVIEGLSTSIFNFLSALRLWLDHAETEIKREFGKVSPEAARFKEATSRAFDDLPGYRFCYWLRNYTQHCGLPLDGITVSAVQDAPTGTPPEISFNLSAERLLTDFEWHWMVKDDLEGSADNIDVFPKIDEAMQGIRDTARAYKEVQQDYALTRVPDLREAISRIRERQGSEGHPAIYAFSGDPAERLTLSPALIPEEDVETLERVRSGNVLRDSLWIEPEISDFTPPFSIGSDPDQYRCDSLGAEVLSTWLNHGNGAQLEELISTILAEEDGADALITGLVNSAARLLLVAAGALGISREAVAGSLLDEYREFFAGS